MRARAERVIRSSWPALAVAAVAVAAWALVAGGALPGPARTARTTAALLADGTLLRVAARTVVVMVAAYSASAVAGVAVGLLVASRPVADRALSPYFTGLQSLPSAVWIPVAVVLLGAHESAVVTVTVLGALPSIALGTRDAVLNIAPLLLRAGRTLGARGRILTWRVVLPAALPGVVSGLEHGWAFAFRALVSGELITGARGAGIGSFVSSAQRAGAVDRMLAGVAVILVIGIVVDRLGFARVQRRLRVERGLALAA